MKTILILILAVFLLRFLVRSLLRPAPVQSFGPAQPARSFGQVHAITPGTPAARRTPTRPVHSGETLTYYAAAASPEEDNRYRFYIHQEPGGGWRAYIRRTPDYRQRDSRPSVAHWLTDSRLGRYICIQGGDPRRKEELLVKMTHWADKTQRYIRTGQNMNQP